MLEHMSKWRRRAQALLVVGAAVVATACAGGGGGRLRTAPAPAASADASASPLEGEWRVVAFERADGGPRAVTGFLRYDRFSNITVHAELSPDDATARPPRVVVADFTAKAAPGNGEFDYQGLRMGVDAERLTTDAVAMNEWRHFQLDGDTLRLSAHAGGRPAATLVFQRVR